MAEQNIVKTLAIGNVQFRAPYCWEELGVTEDYLKVLLSRDEFAPILSAKPTSTTTSYTDPATGIATAFHEGQCAIYPDSNLPDGYGLCIAKKITYNASHVPSSIIWLDTSISKANVEGLLTGTISTHTHTFASLASKPTTLSGYGITDAVTINTAQTISGVKTFSAALTAASFKKSGGTATQFLMADGSVIAKVSRSSVGTLGWLYDTGSNEIPTLSRIAYWDGRYNADSATASNLAYCYLGKFGTMAIANAADYVTLGTAQTISGFKSFTNQFALRDDTCGIIFYKNLRKKAGAIEILGANGAWAANCLEFENNGNLTARHSLTATSFIKSGSSDSYLLLGGGGHKALSDLATASALSTGLARKVSKSGDTMTGRLQISTQGLVLDIGAQNTSGIHIYTSNEAKPIFINTDLQFVGNGDIGNNGYPVGTVYANAINVASNSLVSNLNADLLDGNHATSFLRKVTVANNAVNDFNTFESMTLTGRGDPTTGASLSNAPWTGAGPAGGYGVLTYLWSGYGVQMAFGYNANRVYIRNKYHNSNSSVWKSNWDSIALLTDNVASATKLQTARTIWGQSFNGTANISGNMTGVGTITPSADTTYNIGTASNQFRWIYANCIYAKSGGWLGLGGNNTNHMLITADGKVGIGSGTPAYALDVTGVIHATTGIFSDNYVSAKGQNTSSDARLKDVTSDFALDLNQIANAPSVNFSWKDSHKADVGSIAQYWRGISPHLTPDMPDGSMSLQYGKTALLSVITVAKKTINLQEEVKSLKKEVVILKSRIKELETK